VRLKFHSEENEKRFGRKEGREKGNAEKERL
jgi:hypothetical protein